MRFLWPNGTACSALVIPSTTCSVVAVCSVTEAKLCGLLLSLKSKISVPSCCDSFVSDSLVSLAVVGFLYTTMGRFSSPILRTGVLGLGLAKTNGLPRDKSYGRFVETLGATLVALAPNGGTLPPNSPMPSAGVYFVKGFCVLND